MIRFPIVTDFEMMYVFIYVMSFIFTEWEIVVLAIIFWPDMVAKANKWLSRITLVKQR